jgi:LCP family protein required for cell wall assembly
MNIYVKTFLLSFLVFSLFFGGAFFAYSKYYIDADSLKSEENIANKINVDVSKLTYLERLDYESNRVNFLLFGTDGGRSDTIMFATYDLDTQRVDLISIPRDTYNHVEGFDSKAQRKINAVLGFKGDDGGVEALKATVSRILGVPIDYTLRVEYDGIKNIVDLVGGVEVEVPFRMKYDDYSAEPELHIDLQAGVQTLSGDQSIQFLRWRKNNGEGGQGDIPRTERQQYFVKQLVKQSLSLKLPTVIKEAFKYVETDMPLSKMLLMGTKLTGFSTANMNTYTLPGAPGSDGNGYYIHDPVLTEDLMIQIMESGVYNNQETTTEGQ